MAAAGRRAGRRDGPREPAPPPEFQGTQMTNPNPFDLNTFLTEINDRLDNNQVQDQTAAGEAQSAQVGEQTNTQAASQDQNTDTNTATQAGSGGAGGVALGGAGGSADGGGGFGFGGIAGGIDQEGKTNINFGDGGQANGVGVGGDAGIAGDGGNADAAGGDGGDAVSNVGVDAEASQDQSSNQDLPQETDQGVDS